MGTINRPCQLTNKTTAKMKNIKMVRTENINTDFIFFIKGITPKKAKIYTGQNVTINKLWPNEQ